MPEWGGGSYRHGVTYSILCSHPFIIIVCYNFP